MPNMRDIAKACGVSPMTVSNVLNDRGVPLREETRELVLRTVREMGYRPAVARRTAHIERIKSLGILSMTDLDRDYSYYRVVLAGLLTAINQRGHNAVVFTKRLLGISVHQSLRIYCDGRCDGLILISASSNNDLVATLHDRGTPFVLVGDMTDQKIFASVDVDNVGSAETAVSYLIEQGHRRIAWLAGGERMQFSNERAEGYRRAMAAQGLSVDEELVLAGDCSITSGYERARFLASLPYDRRPTALFCVNDETALGALQAFQDLGIRVPHEMSVIGFDDDPRSAISHPPLTTLRQPYDDLGESAVDMLLAILDGTLETLECRLPTQLIVRNSVAPPAVW